MQWRHFRTDVKPTVDIFFTIPYNYCRKITFKIIFMTKFIICLDHFNYTNFDVIKITSINWILRLLFSTNNHKILLHFFALFFFSPDSNFIENLTHSYHPKNSMTKFLFLQDTWTSNYTLFSCKMVIKNMEWWITTPQKRKPSLSEDFNFFSLPRVLGILCFIQLTLVLFLFLLRCFFSLRQQSSSRNIKLQN